MKPVEIVIGLMLLLAFMYAWGFYKAAGLSGLEALSSTDSRRQFETHSGRSLRLNLLGDLARSDIQSYILYRINMRNSNYQYAYGKTYISALQLMVPSSILPRKFRAPGKRVYGTRVQYGSYSYQPSVRTSSRVYGIAGEAMLNFGWSAVPIVYGLYGVFVSFIRFRILQLDRSDGRILIAPFFVIFAVAALASDSDNLVVLLIKYLAVPLAWLYFSTDRIVNHSYTNMTT
ncbi:hypothetical protein ACFL2H_08165 [Planctomycetota bacterium]